MTPGVGEPLGFVGEGLSPAHVVVPRVFVADPVLARTVHAECHSLPPYPFRIVAAVCRKDGHINVVVYMQTTSHLTKFIVKVGS